MKARYALLGWILLATGCGAPGAHEPASEAASVSTAPVIAPRVVGGTPSSSARDSVVIVASSGGYCSGTLVAPNLVLTARRCFAPENDYVPCGAFGADYAANAFYVAVGASQSPAAPSFSAQGQRILDDASSSICSHDIALLQLDRDIPGAVVAAVRSTPLAAGELTTVIGYGQNGYGQTAPGRYERGGLPVLATPSSTFWYRHASGATDVVQVPAAEFVLGESACSGDRGGPVFDAKGAVVGVSSRSTGTSGTCVDQPQLFTDVPTFYAAIAAAASSAGHPLGSVTLPTADAGAFGPGRVGGFDGGAAGGFPGSSAPPGNEGDGPGDIWSGGGDLSPGVPAKPGAGSSPSVAPAVQPDSGGCAIGGTDAPCSPDTALLGALLIFACRKKSLPRGRRWMKQDPEGSTGRS